MEGWARPKPEVLIILLFPSPEKKQIESVGREKANSKSESNWKKSVYIRVKK